MKYYLFSPEDSEPIAVIDDCFDKTTLLTTMNEVSQETAYTLEEMVIIRGERFDFVPPSDKGQLKLHAD